MAGAERGAAKGAQLVVLWWRDIPAQVQLRVGRTRQSEHLGPDFEKAIDRAAMRAGLTGTDGYLEQWRREAAPLSTEGAGAESAEGAAQEQAALAALHAKRDELLAAYPQERLAALIQGGGYEEKDAP